MSILLKSKFRLLYFVYIVIGLFCIWQLSTYWLSSGFIIAGHDSGLALDSREFLLSRLYAWDGHMGFGQDNSALFGSITIHLSDYLLSLIANTPYAGNHLVVFFWLGLLFLSSFVFSLSLANVFGKPFAFIFPSLITINFYIFQSIFIFERSKYQLQIATLLFLTLLLKFIDNRMNIIFASVLTGLIFFIFNGGSWLGLPLYGGTLVLVSVVVLYLFFEGLATRNFKPFFRLFVFYFFSFLVFLMLNAYSLFPFLETFLNGNYSQLGTEFAKASTEWVRSISVSASFLNLLRLQGIPNWYIANNLPNPGHSFATEYINNYLLIFISFLIPILAFSSFLISHSKKTMRVLTLIGFLVLVSAFFTAGSHKPLGFLYELIYQYVPGFSIFRSPYYKFGGILVIALSILISYSLSEMIKKIADAVAPVGIRYIILGVLTLFVLLSWNLYHFKLFSPQIFSWQKGYGTRLKIPEYVEDFRKWSRENSLENERILLVPPLNEEWKNDGYAWGYWSLSTLPYMLTSKDIVANETNLTAEEKSWVNKLYSLIKDRKEEELLQTSAKLGINYFLLRKDVLVDSSWSPTESPVYYENNLNTISYIEKVRQFGEWVLYKTKTENSNKFTPIFNLISLEGQFSYLSREFLKDEHAVFVKSNDQEDSSIRPFITRKIDLLKCESCFLERYENSSYLPDIRVLPNSPFYVIKEMQENASIEKEMTEQSKIGAYLGAIIRRTAEIKTMLVFGVDEKYMLLNLKKINEYFNHSLGSLKEISDSQNDFVQATMVLINISPVENNLREYARSRQFFERSNEFRKEFLDTLLKIYDIKKFYEPIYSKQLELELEKRYQIKNVNNNNFKLYISKLSLPRDENNQPILPKTIQLKKEKIETNLQIEDLNINWLSVEGVTTQVKDSLLILKFNALPNLFLDKGTSAEQTPGGILGCSVGTIRNFDSYNLYKIKIRATSKNQALRLYFRQDGLTADKEQFLIGNPEVDVFPIYSFEPFIYLYRPSTKAKNPMIYVCNNNKETPQIDKIEVNEVFSPEIVVSEDFLARQQSSPIISFSKINPTKYTVKIDNVTSAFVLKFNERYHDFWDLSSDDKTIVVEKDNFMIDGYSNGWVIKEPGEYVVEYKPQKYFKIGTTITFFTLILSLVTVVLFGVKKINNS